MDGGGPMPSFFWGKTPFPDLGEYYSHRHYYDLLYSVPYLLAGLITTIVGCAVAPLVLRTLRPTSSRIFINTAVATLTMLLLVAVASDAGYYLRFWNGPLFLLHSDISFYDVIILSRIFLPASLLAGVVAAGKGRLRLDTPAPTRVNPPIPRD
jgi:hypothetical protein